MANNTGSNHLLARNAYGIHEDMPGAIVVKTDIMDGSTGRTVMTNYSVQSTASVTRNIAQKN